MDDILEGVGNLSPEKRALLALRLRKKHRDVHKNQGIPRLPQKGKPDTFPLSFAQQRLWFLNQLTQNNPVYNNLVVFRLRGQLDYLALVNSINGIVKRHEILRTTFGTVAGQAVQSVAPSLVIELPVVDLTEVGADKNDCLKVLAARLARQPFDLTKGPNLRATLVHLNRYDYALVLVVHHIIADGWSARIFARELACLYEAYTGWFKIRFTLLIYRQKSI